jgi:hypothetical protein
LRALDDVIAHPVPGTRFAPASSNVRGGTQWLDRLAVLAAMRTVAGLRGR